MRLVDFAPEHFDALISWASTPDQLLLWAGPSFPYPLSAGYLQRHLDSARQTGAAHLYTALDSADQPIGHGEIGAIEDGVGKLMRVVLAPSARGQGHGRKLTEALVQEAFGPLDLRRLLLNVFAFNGPALRCYALCGFRLFRVLPEPRTYAGRPEWVHTMELLRPD